MQITLIAVYFRAADGFKDNVVYASINKEIPQDSDTVEQSIPKEEKPENVGKNDIQLPA